MSCWTILGLPADADTRSIKRQYATLLKQTRPDEDPEGFQRLREAYEHALSIKEWEHLREENSGDDTSWDLTGLSVVEVDTLQLVTRSLDGVSRVELERRHAIAVEHGAVDVMEDAVLRHCVEHFETSEPLLEWAMETFHWFSLWQRLELDEELIEQLLQQRQHLAERREAPIFLARQLLLATQPAATPEHRAAHLLLAPGTFSQRRALARRLREDDWVQCRKLSSALYANHPDICADLPGGTPFFWRDWEYSYDSWPMYLGIVLACLVGSFIQFAPLGTRLGGLIGVAVFWSVIFAVAGWVLDWLTGHVAHRFWLLDDRLSVRLSPSLMPLSFGVLRDLIPCIAMAVGIGKVYGVVGSIVYITTLTGVGLIRRREVNPHVSWQHASPLLKHCLMGAGILVLVLILGVFKVISSQGTVNRNQGLQQWTERLCSRMPVTASECTAPATVEQWYGQEKQP
ncbi:J domain-containing protein [Pseudomonas sp. BGI-2]|uniref:J domain-containing protein n=1 Tax=Pseudomonas sp. BGI-2 TaxID=2528211 RepID=UPI00103350B8|nr:J domain-containing protein [Pseudomonas sp. BGI-2]TBN40327.1 J domain-containing protein [Pseudomonas sp. BGI-2]